MDEWLTLEAVKEVCRKIHTVGGKRPHAVLTRNGETEFLLVFEPVNEKRFEAYGLLPVEGGLLPAYAYGNPNNSACQGSK